LQDDELARPEGGRSVTQKVRQAFSARELEKQWKKSEILEAYLNLVAFRGEIVGINALAQTLFDKHPSGLDWEEAAVAAALVRGPNATAATVAQRACGIPSCDLGRTAAADCLRREHAVGRAASAPFRRHDAAWDQARDRPTLDARLQRVAIDAVRGQLAEFAAVVQDGAVRMLDNAVFLPGSDLPATCPAPRSTAFPPAASPAGGEALRLRARLRAAVHHARHAARRFSAQNSPPQAAPSRRTTTVTSRAGSARARRSARASTFLPCALARCWAPMRFLRA
jgi:hypothetical protein